MPDALKYLCGKSTISLKEFEELFPDTTPQIEIDRLDSAWEQHVGSILTFLAAQGIAASERQYRFAATAFGATGEDSLRQQGVIYGLREASAAFAAAKGHYRAILEKLISEVYARDNVEDVKPQPKPMKTGTRADV